MKYTKQQAEMLALLVVMGCAVVVLAFLYLVKPKFATIANCQKEMKKTEAAIIKIGDAPSSLAKAKNERDALTQTIQNGEKAVFRALEVGSPLTEICDRAASALNLKPAYGDQTSEQLLEFTQRGPQTDMVTLHYDEVSRTLDFNSVDFFDLCRFLSAVEKTNEGLRVAHLDISSASLDPQSQADGKAKVKLDLRMVGVREGDTKEFTVNEPQEIDGRNPFGPPGGPTVSRADPILRVREALSRAKVTGVWDDWLFMEVPETAKTGPRISRVKITKGETAVIAGTKIKYLERNGDIFVFQAIDHGTRFVLETNWKGEVKLKEEETK